ncbi:Divalent-cation tolerance protein CutA [Andreprevotia sp. IGB-42]|nr:Divalent-cation tolerance protein CutA [Andreprevotia sp. IGB-42]
MNRLSPVLSIYRWDGRVETAEEYPLHIKTTVDACPQLLAWLVAHHPYDVPEIIVLPVTDGLPAYLAWVHNEVNA